MDRGVGGDERHRPKQLNLEQRLRRAEVKALLVIAQELRAGRESAPVD